MSLTQEDNLVLTAPAARIKLMFQANKPDCSTHGQKVHLLVSHDKISNRNNDNHIIVTDRREAQGAWKPSLAG